jgi:hypothetical protein
MNPNPEIVKIYQEWCFKHPEIERCWFRNYGETTMGERGHLFRPVIIRPIRNGVKTATSKFYKELNNLTNDYHVLNPWVFEDNEVHSMENKERGDICIYNEKTIAHIYGLENGNKIDI